MKDLTSGVKSEAPLRSKEGGAESVYYIHTGCSGIASRFSLKARRKMYDLFVQTFILSPELKILDVGVTSDRQNPESNYFEQFYPYKHRITCVGTEDAFWLEEHYPGLTFHKIKPD